MTCDTRWCLDFIGSHVRQHTKGTMPVSMKVKVDIGSNKSEFNRATQQYTVRSNPHSTLPPNYHNSFVHWPTFPSELLKDRPWVVCISHLNSQRIGLDKKCIPFCCSHDSTLLGDRHGHRRDHIDLFMRLSGEVTGVCEGARCIRSWTGSFSTRGLVGVLWSDPAIDGGRCWACDSLSCPGFDILSDENHFTRLSDISINSLTESFSKEGIVGIDAGQCGACNSLSCPGFDILSDEGGSGKKSP
jgi:hypothetical protein